MAARTPKVTSTTTSPKEQMLRTIAALPEDSSFEELLKELAFEVMVERGLADSKRGRTVSDDEMSRRIASWAK